MNNENEVKKIYELVVENEAAFCDLTKEGFMAFIATVMDRYCEEHDLDVVEMSKRIATATLVVNEIWNLFIQ